MLTNVHVDKLLEMNRDDIRELLVEEKLNSQDLRELVYRLVGECREYKRAFNYEKELNEQLELRIEKIKSRITEF